MTYLYVALGGAIGAILRLFTVRQATHIFGTSFPTGTFIVNVLGSMAMGIFVGYLAKNLSHSMEFRSFIAVGLLGGFTTFSAFSFDIATMIERGNLPIAVFYAIGSVTLSVLAVFAGLYLMRQV